MSIQQAFVPSVSDSLRTPFALRIVRALRVAVHVLESLAIIFFVFPWASSSGRRRRIRRWSQRLLAMLGVHCKVGGIGLRGLPGNLMLVANHVSWLDIFVILSLRATRFVGKSELGHWPLLGHLIKGTGTILIDRGKRHDTARINKTISDVLATGDCVTVFPEGTTTDGRHVLHFHGSLLQPVIDARGHVAPIALAYRNALGERSESPIYIGETTFLQSFWWILGERRLHVEATFLPLLPACDGLHRRELALSAQNAIAQALEVPLGHKWKNDR